MKLFVLCTLVAAAYSLPLDGGGVPTKNVSALDSRIISGHEATLTQFPWQAYLLIFFNSNDIFSCGGSLIHMRWVLTAAHCLEENMILATHVSMWFGIIDIADTSGAVFRDSSEFHIHPEYDYHNDIALIKLNEIVPDTENVHVIMLGNDVYSRFDVETSGFGDTEQGSSTKLHYARLTILRNCVRSNGIPVQSTEMCASPGTGATCPGDSGGAVVTQENGQWKQVGVVEGGTIPGCHFGPVIFTRVTDFRNWIVDTMVAHE